MLAAGDAGRSDGIVQSMVRNLCASVQFLSEREYWESRVDWAATSDGEASGQVLQDISAVDQMSELVRTRIEVVCSSGPCRVQPLPDYSASVGQ